MHELTAASRNFRKWYERKRPELKAEIADHAYQCCLGIDMLALNKHQLRYMGIHITRTQTDLWRLEEMLRATSQ